MVIISHDRHFLSAVCTHMADVDYGGIRVYAGTYDDYMEASALAKQQLEKDNAKAKDRIADLEDFVRRFRAHKAKARQATSRRKMIEKLKVEDVKPSAGSTRSSASRSTRRAAGWLRKWRAEGYGARLNNKFKINIEAGKRSLHRPQRIGKTTLLRCSAKI
jgi:ATPase subunit of ABC transporter with duplicated ATPase domains